MKQYVFLFFLLSSFLSLLELKELKTKYNPYGKHPSKTSKRKYLFQMSSTTKTYDLDVEKYLIRNCKNKNTFALTFDDGPDSKVTQGVLDILKLKKIKATFFLVAKNIMKNKNNIAAAKRTLKEGHQIAHHSYDHSNFVDEIYEKDNWCEKIVNQMKKSDEIFVKTLGVSPRYFRPPYGSINLSIVEKLDKFGYKIALWNLDTMDWYWDTKGRDRLEIVNSYKRELLPKPKEDSFISLQHDKQRDIEANRERYNYIIDLVLSKGFKFVTLDECVNGDEEKVKGKYFSGKKKDRPDFTKCSK